MTNIVNNQPKGIGDSIFDILLNSNIWEVILAVVIILLALSFSIILLLWFINKITKGKWELPWIKRSGSNAKESCTECARLPDIVLSFKRITKITSDIFNIENITMFHRQLSKAEEYLIQLKQHYTYIFMDILITKINPEHVTHTTDYYYFNNFITDYIDNLRNLIKVTFKQNGLSRYKGKESEYEQYIKEKTEYILSYTRDYFNLRYSDKTVSRSEMYNSENKEENLHKIKKLLRDIYISAKNIAIDCKENIEDLETIREEVIYNATGYKDKIKFTTTSH